MKIHSACKGGRAKDFQATTENVFSNLLIFKSCGPARIPGVDAEIPRQYRIMEDKHRAAHHRRISKRLVRLLTQKGKTVANTRSDQP